MTTISKTFTRQLRDPNGDLQSVNEQCGVAIVKHAVVLRQGHRIIGYFDKWPDQEKLQYIRDEFIRVLLDPRNAADPDWSLLEA